MDISEAKKQVRYSVQAYLSKNEYGEYKIPIERQRPLFLIGPPGVGKTEIMSQVAREMDIALVAYSMTHHTRQSALGLPFINQREFEGREYRTTEYTMSEIIASIYDAMGETGMSEGILFLDEINCISETLSPSMLQFLQYKTFGMHRVPQGWVVVTAGNPPEYNNSVRAFDLATLDRLKILDIEPNLGAWMKYARNEGVHGSILSYLQVRREDFYSVQETVDGKSFVTARGWVDLSEMMGLYEENGLPIDIELIGQYIQDSGIARNFSAYYDLFFQYKSRYDVLEILEGNIGEGTIAQAKGAPFDERVIMLRLLSDALIDDFCSIFEIESIIKQCVERIRSKKDSLEDDAATREDIIATLDGMAEAEIESMRREKRAHDLSRTEVRVRMGAVEAFGEMVKRISSPDEEGGAPDIIRRVLAEKNDRRRELATKAGRQLENVFSFLEDAYGEDDEMAIFIATLTENRYSADFIGRYGSEGYFRHNESVMVFSQEQQLGDAIDELMG